MQCRYSMPLPKNAVAGTITISVPRRSTVVEFARPAKAPAGRFVKDSQEFNMIVCKAGRLLKIPSGKVSRSKLLLSSMVTKLVEPEKISPGRLVTSRLLLRFSVCKAGRLLKSG